MLVDAGVIMGFRHGLILQISRDVHDIFDVLSSSNHAMVYFDTARICLVLFKFGHTLSVNSLLMHFETPLTGSAHRPSRLLAPSRGSSHPIELVCDIYKAADSSAQARILIASQMHLFPILVLENVGCPTVHFQHSSLCLTYFG